MRFDQRDSQPQLRDNKSQIILLKSQKLASALYLVTKYMSDDDPLKWQLRDLSLRVSSSIDPIDLSAALQPIGQMVALIDIALHGQAVSQMNFTIIKQEYLSLRNMIMGERTKYNPVNEIPNLPNYYSSLPPTTLAPRTPSSMPANNHISGHKPLVQPSPYREGDSQRQQLILKFIKEKGWSSIKDIAGAVPNFSTKTVQRELIDLVRLGVLKKEGERRWSRYQLANTR